MSRQRIRASVLGSSTDKCVLCGGTGHVRSVSSVALQLLRLIEETLLKGGTHNLIVRTRTDIALYLLNHKRAHLRDLEQRFQIAITINADAAMGGQQPFAIEKGEQVFTVEQARAIAQQPTAVHVEEAEGPADATQEDAEAEDAVDEGEDAGEVLAFEPQREEARGETGEGGRGRRRRRRRGRRGGEGRPADGFVTAPVADAPAAAAADEAEDAGEDAAEEADTADAPHAASEAEDAGGEGRRRRRRGRRGGRRNRRGVEGQGPHEEQSVPPPIDHVSHEADDPFAPPAEHVEHVAPVEPELVSAVADFGGAPPQPQTPVAEAPAPEPPRRRSTVREPVSFPTNGGSSGSTPAPVPTAEATEHAPVSVPDHPAAEDADRPRRTGWWAKRLLGDRG
jgi:ribonuclease E